jgi:wobble nucleotide-excising tRNase
MIQRIQLLRNIGQFDSVTVHTQLVFAKTTIVYAENGRGKTTLAAILRSLSSGDGKLITERKRLNSTNAPHVVITASGTHIFQNGTWTQTYPDILIFDDAFVSRNVCSGIEVGSDHRQNLHELILGEQGVSLNATLQAHVTEVEDHNRALTTKSAKIPAVELNGLTVDVFCNLKAVPNIEAKIEEAERSHAAALASDSVSKQSVFRAINLPAMEEEQISGLLLSDLARLESVAADRVQAQVAKLGKNGERWIAEGMQLLGANEKHNEATTCPFCVQPLDGSSMIAAYRGYFSEEYAKLNSSLESAVEELETMHGGRVAAGFERSVSEARDLREFWSKFLDISVYEPDTAAVARAWEAAKSAAGRALLRKQNKPLEKAALTEEESSAISSYKSARQTFQEENAKLVANNTRIAVVKEQAASANVATLAADLAKLRAARARHSTAIGPLCGSYVAEKAAKKITEGKRDIARTALNAYRTSIFPTYETAINKYLKRFNAGFRVQSVSSVNTRGGSSCTYSMVINNVPVDINASDGSPCFRNTLSAGDRNTLALAFFFASLEQDSKLDQRVVVIDDPMTSLDEHRSLTTIQETSRLTPLVRQVVVLSHSKPFLCELWEDADRTSRAALRLIRVGTSSELAAWDVNQDLITEHDKRHAAVEAFIKGPATLHGSAGTDERYAAASLRLILEAYMRVAYPADFPPGTMLGHFHDKCIQRLAHGTPILRQPDADELRDLLDYANKFHHDTNLAYQTEQINDQQLLDFSQRTLAFTSRP